MADDRRVSPAHQRSGNRALRRKSAFTATEPVPFTATQTTTFSWALAEPTEKSVLPPHANNNSFGFCSRSLDVAGDVLKETV